MVLFFFATTYVAGQICCPTGSLPPFLLQPFQLKLVTATAAADIILYYIDDIAMSSEEKSSPFKLPNNYGAIRRSDKDIIEAIEQTLKRLNKSNNGIQ